MSDMLDPNASGTPAGNSSPPPRPQGRSCLGVAFFLSFLLNLVAGFAIILGCFGLFSGRSLEGGTTTLTDQFHSGNQSAKDKVAIIRLEGVILEGMLDYAHKQIDTAAHDKNVKAIVLRVNSPGGSITASDDLHHRLMELRDGNTQKKTTGKPLVVSMGGMAASGGYYVSMPGKVLYAERTTLTGSIGVYISFPNVKELGDKVGFKMELVKQGAVKDSGSPFKEMTPEERQVWQDMVNNAYGQFKEIVEKGRPALKGKLEDKIIDRRMDTTDKDGKRVPFQYVRQRADGGVFTADMAKEFGLIDKIGYLEDAIQEAATLGGLGADNYKAVTYEKPFLFESLLGMQAPSTPSGASQNLANALTPRLWFLAPQSELAGLAAALGR